MSLSGRPVVLSRPCLGAAARIVSPRCVEIPVQQMPTLARSVEQFLLAAPRFPDPTSPLCLIIDANYLLRRFFLVTSSAQRTVRLFNSRMNQMLKGFRPTHGAIVFDPPAHGFRRSLSPLYKIQRTWKDPALKHEFYIAVEETKQLISNVGRIRSVCIDGFEADDVIATIARRSERASANAVVCSADKDLFQLLSDRTVICDPSKRFAIIDSVYCKTRFGVAPASYADYLALVGDRNDNIFGIRGFGPVRAAEVLKENGGSVENVYERIRQGLFSVQKSSLQMHLNALRDVLVEHEQELRQNLVLTRLVDDVPAVPQLDELSLDTTTRFSSANSTLRRKEAASADAR